VENRQQCGESYLFYFDPPCKLDQKISTFNIFVQKLPKIEFLCKNPQINNIYNGEKNLCLKLLHNQQTKLENVAFANSNHQKRLTNVVYAVLLCTRHVVCMLFLLAPFGALISLRAGELEERFWVCCKQQEFAGAYKRRSVFCC
jgi:hypothetical protein